MGEGRTEQNVNRQKFQKYPLPAAMTFDTPLPIDAVLSELRAALATRASVVLVAPPGAGKTTRVPLALMDESWLKGRKILVLEPRRIAAKAAAERMARTVSEAVGERIGLRARMVSKSGPKTRIEVVTEGVFTRMILDDPELSGVGAVLFDEFHERSLDADLGLALALDSQRGLRDDLRILPMSATLDGARVARLLGQAPVIESIGRAFPVETRYLGRDDKARIEDQMADAVMRALRAEPGSILAFLPGQGEIRRVEERLRERIGDPAIVLAPLYGAMDREAQDLALEPAPKGRRKIVLATSIAETSITIEGVRVVIDSGLSRVPRFEPDVGVTRLETVRVSRAAADQRRGRAGRTGPGVCFRLWDEPQTQSLPPFTEPEIRSADLAGLMLDCAEWGTADPRALSWLDPPGAAAIDAAREELTELEALDGRGRITAMGKRLRSLPLPPGSPAWRLSPPDSATQRRPPKSLQLWWSAGLAATTRISPIGWKASAATARAAPATCESWRLAGPGWQARHRHPGKRKALTTAGCRSRACWRSPSRSASESCAARPASSSSPMAAAPTLTRRILWRVRRTSSRPSCRDRRRRRASCSRLQPMMQTLPSPLRVASARRTRSNSIKARAR